MIILKLLWSFIQIGIMSIGGGLAALPLIQQQTVDINHWLTMSEFLDLITIAQMTPGPIAINAATFVGMRIAGLPGAIVATLGCVLPSWCIVLTLAFLYNKFKSLNAVKATLGGLRPAVVALISSAGITIFIMALWGVSGFDINFLDINLIAVGIFLLGFFVLRKYKPNPVWIILGSGLIGTIIYSIFPQFMK